MCQDSTSPSRRPNAFQVECIKRHKTAIIPRIKPSLLVFGRASAYVYEATAFHSLNAKLFSPSASGAWPGQPPFRPMCASAPLKHVLGARYRSDHDNRNSEILQFG